jgi:hypothetical protein
VFFRVPLRLKCGNWEEFLFSSLECVWISFLSKSSKESPYRITRLASTLVLPYLNISLTDFYGKCSRTRRSYMIRYSIYYLFHSSMSNCNLKTFVINYIMSVKIAAPFVANSVQRKQAMYQIELIISVLVVPCQIVHTTFDSDKCFRCWHVTYMDDFKDEYYSLNGEGTNQRYISHRRLNTSHRLFANPSSILLSCCTEWLNSSNHMINEVGLS